ncbi:MAG: SLBB domain-containing protein [Calditrichia bacterium]|nr:SLBB domain-containing protein [Calditrichia bacterium]
MKRQKKMNCKYAIRLSQLLSIIIFFVFQSVYSQDFPQSDQRTESVLSLMGLGADNMTQMPDLKDGTMLMASVNEDEYRVDAGDVFIIKVDVKGPAFKIFNSIVTPDGYLIIPDAPTVYVRYMTLREAKYQIDKVLKKNFPQATVESYLFQIHPIRVSVLGAIPIPGKIMLNSSDRLFDAVTGMINPFLNDTTILFNWDIVSFRNIEIRRTNETKSYDLLKYKFMGERNENPYLMDEDIVYINFRDSTRHIVSVRGAIARPVEFEYKHGDRLITAIRFASRLLPTADSSRIELVRFNEKTSGLESFTLSFPGDSSLMLRSDDRIYVREKVKYHKKYSVYIKGEVKYPGEYAIENGKTFLSDIIEQAGGFTDDAAILSSSVLRKKALITDEEELKRLQKIRPEEMTSEEASYYRLRTRENRYIVTVDFNKLHIDKDLKSDVPLFDKDFIIIPERTMTVFVSGGVVSPGNITYRPDWTYENYINAAGGFTDLARESWITIINSKTGKWIDIDDDEQVREGDIIFIPERDRADWYSWFLHGLGVVAQISAVVLVVITLAK